MATGTIPSNTLPPPPPRPAESLAHEQIIKRQLGRAMWHVRLVDLASSLTVWAVCVLAFFLVAALVDHWIGLGISGRFVALAILLGGTAYYLILYVAPLLLHTINPTYAARTIEEATPSLKNSLINFLLLRQDRANIREIVYQAVERKAASDIAVLPVETTVDRSRLIHAGYVLLGVMALFAAYKILSPKDPFQTVARVLAPWADIARPSRVQITDVQPGSREVYHGQTVKVSATVHGIREGQPVKVLYSTADGQTVDRPVALTAVVGGRYEGTLPPEAGPGDSPLSDFSTGIQQNVTYRIVAGDAETTSYRLTAIEAPTIIVDRLEYHYPAYTKLPPQTILQQGDIKALEGTKVAIHAVANQPVKLARVEFDVDSKDGRTEMMPLAAEGSKASGTTTLLLKPDRRSPWHASYQVRFYNERGQQNQQPIQHRIEVLRDLAPEVQILRPERVRIEVPEDGEEWIEVRAVDPDFGLSSVRIEGAVGGKPAVKVELLGTAAEQPAQATLPYVFRPSEHKLAVGDELKYLVTAEDNRTSPLNGNPEPNVTRTAEYTLVVTPPKNRDATQRQPGGAQSPNAGPGQPEKRQDKNAAEGERSQNNQRPAPADPSQPQPMNQGAGQQQEQPRTPQQGADQQNQQNGKGKQEKGQQGQGQGGQQPGQQGGQPQAGQQPGGQAGNAPEQPQQGQQQGTGPLGANSGAQQSDNPMADGGPQGANPQSPKDATGQNAEPVRRQDKAHDGEAIERVFKELEKEGAGGQQPAVQQQQSGAQQQGAGQSKSKTGEDQQGEGKPAPMPGEHPQSQPQGAGKSGAQGKESQESGKPGPSDQKLGPMGQGQQGQGEKSKPQDRLPDEKQGQNSAEQPSGGNKGGVPKGPSKTNQEEQSSKSEGQKRDAGAGQQGAEGAGDASKDKKGSGEGTKANRDTDKKQKADNSKPQEGEPSPPSESKKQSDSKGGQSGDQSGGGKQGSGQSAGQEGNDSAGSKSAADQGAGKAGETGSGETGSNAGSQQEAAGKTGQSGQQKGEGSGTKADEAGSTPSPQGEPQKTLTDQERGERTKDQQSQGDRGGGAPGTSRVGGGSGQPIEGGGDGERLPADPTATAEAQAADAANLEYSRKATEMVLKRLKDEEHNPDPELLDKLGWSKEDLAEFLRRWDALQRSAQENPDGKRELDEALRSLGLRNPANRKRAGGATSDTQRDLRDAGNRSAAPPKYRDLYDSFRKGAARSRQ